MAVVTGGGRGLGRGIALASAEAGFDLLLGWVSDSEAASETATAAAALPPRRPGRGSAGGAGPR